MLIMYTQQLTGALKNIVGIYKLYYIPISSTIFFRVEAIQKQ